MISNQAASTANMTGNLFQIFNLPKSGNSSYLFSDIIKVIGTEPEGETVNSLTSSFFADSSKSLIDSDKLISLLKANITAGNTSEDNGEDLSGKYYITEAELTQFINKLGLEDTAEAAKLSPEIAVEVTPAFLNKLTALLNSSKSQASKNIFATIAPEEEKPKEIKLSDGEESDEAEGPEKIQVIFKKVSPESEVIAAPQQVVFNSEQNSAFGTGKVETEGEFLFGGQSKNITLGGSNYEFFADTSSGKTQGAQVLSGGDTAPAGKSEKLPLNQNNTGSAAFAEVFAEMNASVESTEPGVTTDIPEAIKTFKSDGSFFVQEPGAEVETPVVGVPAAVKTAKNAGENVVSNSKTINPAAQANMNEANMNEANMNEANMNEANEIITQTSVNITDAVDEGSVEVPASGNNAEINTALKPGSEAALKNETKVKIENEVKSTDDSGKNLTNSNTAAGSEQNTKASAAEKEPGTELVNKEAVNDDETIKKPEVQQGEKAGQKETVKVLNESGKPGTVKTEHANNIVKDINSEVKVNDVRAKESSDRVFREDIPGDASKQEFESSFRFSSRFTNELFKKNNVSINQTVQGRDKADNSNIYEISFEKTKPENNYFGEKILPQDFNTSDYETLSSGIFTSKTSESFKEFKPVEKADASAENNSLKLNNEIKNSNSSEEQAANTGSNQSGSKESAFKQSHKTVNEAAFSDHLQHRTAGVNEITDSKPLKSYTSVFKEVDAAHLVDEIKSICVKGEKSNITLKLSPEHLGAVKLSIDIKDSVMSTSIEVENESVRQVVQNNMETLRQTLQQNGIQLSSFSVSLSNQHEQKSSGKSGNKKEKQQENEGIDLKSEEKTVKTKKLGYNTYEYLA